MVGSHLADGLAAAIDAAGHFDLGAVGAARGVGLRALARRRARVAVLALG